MTLYPEIWITKVDDPVKNDLFEVVEPCKVEIMGPRLTIVIPEGYRTDFASVPQWLWSIIPPHGKMAKAAILHDYMYDNRLFEAQQGVLVARQLADTIFLKNMLAAGVPSWQARTYYYAVRIFGLKWWLN